MHRYASIPQSASLTAIDQGVIATGNHTDSDSLRGAPPFTQGSLVIGITGGTGCGKTTLLNLIAAQGGLILDCDAIYHELLASDTAMLAAIEKRFPGVVENESLNRKRLGAIVFADENALLDLNRITHAAVKQEVLRRLETAPKLAAIDAIGLFEGGLGELCHVTVAVTAPESARVARLMAREGIGEGYARSRIRAQKDEAYFRERCTVTLENSGTIGEFQEKCRRFLAEILD